MADDSREHEDDDDNRNRYYAKRNDHSCLLSAGSRYLFEEPV